MKTLDIPVRFMWAQIIAGVVIGWFLVYIGWAAVAIGFAAAWTGFWFGVWT